MSRGEAADKSRVERRRIGRRRRPGRSRSPKAGRFPYTIRRRPQHDCATADLETASVSRSHLSARHLLQQIESDRSKRARRDIRPAWLTALIERVAELFDPVDEVGRVGFDCRLDEEGWTVALYLGAVELVGGKTDGQLQCAAFRFDLKSLLDGFSAVERVEWNVV